ncbi:MAG: DUF1178 family protein [Alphaproteobacteria bacterium]|nr:DUF1178 family protein [Alphaproteobacteria bacterium]
MIRYALRCHHDHSFESWFQSSSAYDAQVSAGLVNCPVCGTSRVEKAIMAPQIVSSKGRDGPQPAESGNEAEVTRPDLMMTMEQELRSRLRQLRDHVLKNADNVGPRFPTEARAMHYGDIDSRPIYGEASTEEARALIEEGIEIAALPTLPEDRN